MSKKKEPKRPTAEVALIRCNCGKHHGSYYRGNCPTGCKDLKTGQQFPIGECPTCQCHCTKVTKVTNFHAVLAQRRMLQETRGFMKTDVQKEVLEFLDRGEKIRANAKTDIEHEYTRMAANGKLLHSKSHSIARTIENHASLSKALSIVSQPPSRQIQQAIQRKMKVCLQSYVFISCRLLYLMYFDLLGFRT